MLDQCDGDRRAVRHDRHIEVTGQLPHDGEVGGAPVDDHGLPRPDESRGDAGDAFLAARVEAAAGGIVGHGSRGGERAAVDTLAESCGGEITIPRGLKSLVDAFGFGGERHWEVIVTASVIATIPMIIVFFLAQRQIIQGVSTSGLKG